MVSVIHQAQDKLFKQFMSDMNVAKSFFEKHLSPALLKQIDLRTLKLEKESFIDECYKSSEADVLYSVNFENRKAYLYALCEQQSEIDQTMAFRLLVYTIRIMEIHLKNYPGTGLPIVHPGGVFR